MFPVEAAKGNSTRCLSLVPVAAGKNGEFLTVITKNVIIGQMSHSNTQKLGEAAINMEVETLHLPLPSKYLPCDILLWEEHSLLL